MISLYTLEVLKVLVRLALHREQDIRLYGVPEENFKDKKLVVDLLCNPPNDLM